VTRTCLLQLCLAGGDLVTAGGRFRSGLRKRLARDGQRGGVAAQLREQPGIHLRDGAHRGDPLDGVAEALGRQELLKRTRACRLVQGTQVGTVGIHAALHRGEAVADLGLQETLLALKADQLLLGIAQAGDGLNDLAVEALQLVGQRLRGAAEGIDLARRLVTLASEVANRRLRRVKPRLEGIEEALRGDRRGRDGGNGDGDGDGDGAGDPGPRAVTHRCAPQRPATTRRRRCRVRIARSDRRDGPSRRPAR